MTTGCAQGESWDWNSESHRSLDGESLRLLDCMHCLGVLHGDIHRGNIIVTPSQQVVLLDFGHSVYPASPSDMAAEQQWLQDILAIKVRTCLLLAGTGFAFACSCCPALGDGSWTAHTA